MPLPNPDLRATDRPNADEAVLAAARERVTRLLTDRFAEDAITMDEFEARLDQLHSARTASELNVLMRDLAHPGGGLSVDDRAGAGNLAGWQGHVPDGRTGAPREGRLLAILGETKRTGPWIVPARLDVQVVLGDVLIDLRDAVLPPGGCEIALVCVIGRVRVLVAPGVVVDDGVTPAVSTVRNDAEHGGERSLGTPQVRLTGTAVVSEVVVRVAPAGERAKDAWQHARPSRRRK